MPRQNRESPLVLPRHVAQVACHLQRTTGTGHQNQRYGKQGTCSTYCHAYCNAHNDRIFVVDLLSSRSCLSLLTGSIRVARTPTSGLGTPIKATRELERVRFDKHNTVINSVANILDADVQSVVLLLQDRPDGSEYLKRTSCQQSTALLQPPISFISATNITLHLQSNTSELVRSTRCASRTMLLQRRTFVYPDKPPK